MASLALPAIALHGRSAAAVPVAQLAQTQIRPTLKLGSTGISVEEVQALLTFLGYYTSAVNGTYQASTEQAVRMFQQDVGLTSDGIVGPATWAKLLPTPSTDFSPPAVSANAAPDDSSQNEAEDLSIRLPTLKQGVRGPAVASVQESLASLGFYTGPIDGVFGPGTEAAVMAFQRSANLAADGVIGPDTWQALLR